MHRILRALELSQLMARALAAERARGCRRGDRRAPGKDGPHRPDRRLQDDARSPGPTRPRDPGRTGRSRAVDEPHGDRGDRLPRGVPAAAGLDARDDPAPRAGARHPDGAPAPTTRSWPSRHPADRPPVAVDRWRPDRSRLSTAEGGPPGSLRPVRRLGVGRGVRLVHADPPPGDDRQSSRGCGRSPSSTASTR